MTNDNPSDLVHDVFCKQAWPGHPLGRPVLGTEDSINTISRDAVAAYYHDNYVPGRLVVAAAGNVEHDTVIKLVRDGMSRAGKTPSPRVPASPRKVNRGASYEPRQTEQAHIVWGCEGIARQDPDRYALAVLNTLFGGGMSSRLFQEVREKRGLVYAIYSYHHAYAESGLFSVYAGTSESAAPQVLDLVREQAALVASGDAGADEVERAKGHVKGSLVLSMDDPGGRMSRLGRSELHDGEILGVDELLARVDAVTSEDVSRLATRIFMDGELSLVCIGPIADGALDRSVAPLS